jgi:hypothetical protein
LIDHFDAADKSEPPAPTHRSTLYRLGEMVRAAVMEFDAAGFVSAAQGGAT